jgi:type III secretion protein J
MRGAGTICLAVGLLAACSTPIRHGLDEPSANEVVTALERAGVGAEKVRDEAGGPSAFIVRVAAGDAVLALDTLHTLGLPRGRRTGFAEVYAQPSLVPTATEERARYVEALSGEIERTLETVDGVVSARVHLVMEEADPLQTKPRVAAQAAVLLKTRPNLPQIKDADVQKLVAGSVPGLAPSSVAVVATPAAEVQPSTTLTPVGPLRVSPGTRSLLVGTLVVALGVLAVLAILLLFTARRLAAAQRELAPRA